MFLFGCIFFQGSQGSELRLKDYLMEIYAKGGGDAGTQD